MTSTGLAVREGLLTVAQIHGVRGVQVDAYGPLLPEHLTQTGRREIRSLIRGYNLELTAVQCPLRKSLDTIEHYDARLDYIQRSMQLCYDLGCRLVIVPCPSLAAELADIQKKASDTMKSAGGTSSSSPANPDNPMLPRSIISEANLSGLNFSGANFSGEQSATSNYLQNALQTLARFSDRIGVTLALEIGIDSAEIVTAYLETKGLNSIQINFDPANFLIHGHNPSQQLFPLSGRIAHTHARDVRRSGLSRGPQEVAVGHGDIDWLSYFATLSAIEYRGFIVLERESGSDPLTDLKAGVKFLQRFVPAENSSN